MNNRIWNEEIKNNFSNAATDYLSYSNVQKYFAQKIVSFLKELNLQQGEWIDLGSGTGLLADEIEKEFSTKKITRIDFSKKMLLQNKKSSKKILWDLNNPLPPSINKCALMTSNFCIHWLDNPEKILRDWFSKLSAGGYLIISYPTINSFPEWKETCKETNIEYSGLILPNSKNIIKSFNSNEIFFSDKYLYVEKFPDVYNLFRSMVKVGAQSTKCKRKKVYELKKMQKSWPKKKNNLVNLSWEISIQILKKS